METFGDFLKALRKPKMTQRELAEKLNVGYPYISKLENNKETNPSDLLLYNMAEVLNVDKVELFKRAKRVPKEIQTHLIESEDSLNLLFKMTEEKERRSKNHKKNENDIIKNLLNTKNVIIMINPLTGEIMEANESATNFYKYSLKELRRKRIIDLNTLPEKVVKEKMKEATSLNQNFFNFQHRIKSGEIKNVQVFSTPFAINQQKVLYSTIIPKDCR